MSHKILKSFSIEILGFSCANFVTTGIEHTLTFTLADGVTTKTYDGSTDVTLSATEMTPTTTPSTLTLQHGSTSVGTYSTTDQTLTIPRTVAQWWLL